MSEKCWVVEVRRGKPRVKKGSFLASAGLVFNRKTQFGVPDAVKPDENFKTAVTLDRKSTPIFLVNVETQLAHSVGGVLCTDEKLGAKLEVAKNNKYVKALVARVLDTTTLLIAMGAGAGVLFAGLTVLSALTGNPIVFGSSS